MANAENLVLVLGWIPGSGSVFSMLEPSQNSYSGESLLHWGYLYFVAVVVLLLLLLFVLTDTPAAPLRRSERMR